MRRNFNLAAVILGALLLPPAAFCQNVDGEILDDKIAPGADTPILLAEAKLFDTIRKGIAISLAQCEVDIACDPAVNHEELERVLEKLDQRINLLATRHAETGEESLEEVLLAYADVRDEYSGFVDKLGEIVPPEPEAAGEGFDLFGDTAPARGLPEAYSVFEDADLTIEGDDEFREENTDAGDDVPAGDAAPAEQAVEAAPAEPEEPAGAESTE